MKTVLAPIDFSDVSLNALAFAAEISKRSAARLLVLNVFQENSEEKEVSARLKTIVSDLKSSLGADFECASVAAQGNLITALKDVIAVHQPDLIVMGTKGASGLKSILIGSNTVNVIAKTNVPVLVIPEVALFENFNRVGKNRIILATDLDEVKNDKALDLLKEIALLMIEPRIRVLSVRPENTELDYMARMEREALLSFFRPEVESERITVFSRNVIRGINFYLDKHDDTGLVAMVARDSGALIQKHYTHEMASNTHYPLLVLQEVQA